MSAIKAQNLREKTDQELQDQLVLEKKRLFDGVVKSSSGEAIKAHEKREGRRLIARIQTILRERARRKQLDATISALEVKAKDASPAAKSVVKKVDQRLAQIKAELAKPEGKRKIKPMPTRVRIGGDDTTLADRSAGRLAEAKRLKASIERQDVGQGK